MNMFRILALWVALAATPLLAQTLIVGQVVDGEEPIPNAAVRVMGPDGPVSQTVTDAQGNFQLTVPNGSYRLVARPLGYQPVMRPIDAKGAPIKLGILNAIASSTELEEAKVEGQASRALLGMDRKVYDVASDRARSMVRLVPPNCEGRQTVPACILRETSEGTSY